MKTINTVYIVDDDPIFVFTAKRVVQLADFCREYHVFENGRLALNNIQKAAHETKQLPDVILLDLNMPEMDGWQFLDELQKQQLHEKTSVYIVSSSIDCNDIDRARQYKCVKKYIIKPLTVPALREITDEIANSSDDENQE